MMAMPAWNVNVNLWLLKIIVSDLIINSNDETPAKIVNVRT